MTRKMVVLTFCRNLGWSAIVSIVSAAICIGLAMLGANDAPLLAIIFTLAGPIVALVCAFTILRADSIKVIENRMPYERNEISTF